MANALFVEKSDGDKAITLQTCLADPAAFCQKFQSLNYGTIVKGDFYGMMLKKGRTSTSS